MRWQGQVVGPDDAVDSLEQAVSSTEASSRTLPGQLCGNRRASVPGRGRRGAADSGRRCRSSRDWASTAMSSRRWRSGGMAKRTAVRRKARSGSSWPWAAIWRSEVCDEASTTARPGARSWRALSTPAAGPGREEPAGPRDLGSAAGKVAGSASVTSHSRGVAALEQAPRPAGDRTEKINGPGYACRSRAPSMVGQLHMAARPSQPASTTCAMRR